MVEGSLPRAGKHDCGPLSAGSQEEDPALTVITYVGLSLSLLCRRSAQVAEHHEEEAYKYQSGNCIFIHFEI